MSAAAQINWDDEAKSAPQVKWDDEAAAPKTAQAPAVTQPSTWEKLTRGYNPDVEQFAEKHPGIVGTGARTFDAIGGMIPNLPSTVLSTLKDAGQLMTGNSAPMLRDAKGISDWFDPKTRPTWQGIKSVLPEAIGQGVGSVATGEMTGKLIPKVSEATGVARENIGNRLHTQEGKLTPTAKTIGQLGGGAAGGAVGEAVGHPYAGGIAGYKAGPMLIDKLFPESEERIAARERANEIGSPSNPAWHSALPKKMPSIPRVGSEAQEAGYYPAITKVPIRPEPSYRLTPESVPGPDTAGKGNLLTPIAKRGDPRAAAELQRRGRNVLYVPAEEYPAPREVIRNIGEEPEPTTIPEIQRTRRLQHAAD